MGLLQSHAQKKEYSENMAIAPNDCFWRDLPFKHLPRPVGNAAQQPARRKSRLRPVYDRFRKFHLGMNVSYTRWPRTVMGTKRVTMNGGCLIVNGTARNLSMANSHLCCAAGTDDGSHQLRASPLVSLHRCRTWQENNPTTLDQFCVTDGL